MGAWGHGNFENDTSADHLAEITGRLVSEVEEAMANPEELEPDEYWACAVPCNIEILNLIAAKHWAGTILPTPATVEDWKKTYMTVWERCIDDLDPEPEHKRQQHAVLLMTFDTLAEHARRLHDD